MRRPRLAIFALTMGPIAGCTALLGYGDEAQLARPPDADDAGAADAPTESGSAPRGFCETRAPKPTFCASFDGPGFLAEWTESHAGNARLERDTGSFVSPPASLRVAVDRADDGEVFGAVGATFDAWTDEAFSVTIGFDVQIEAAAPANALAVIATPLVISRRSGGASYLAQIIARPLADGSSVSLGLAEVSNGPDVTREHPSSISLQMGTWAHLDLTMTIGGPDDRARLSVDGAVGFDGPLELSSRGVPAASFGLATVDRATTAWAYRLDDVTVDFR